MANNYTNILRNISNTLEVEVYKLPLKINSGFIHSLYITNTNPNSSSYIDLILASGQIRAYLCKNLEIPNNEVLVFDKNINFNKDQANTLIVKTNTADSQISIIGSLVEIK